jgi:hypothetical protein
MSSRAGSPTHRNRVADPPTVTVPRRRVPVLAEADVLVCGGGPAGITAAVSAARHGANVILLERWPSVGGQATNAHIPNLAVAGRCASSTHEGLASVRIQTHCMVMGQGVGTCAALALDAGVDMAGVDTRRLQDALRDNGVYLEDVPTNL